MVEVNFSYNFSTKLGKFLTPVLVFKYFLIVILCFLIFPSRYFKPIFTLPVVSSPRLAAGGKRDTTQMELVYCLNITIFSSLLLMRLHREVYQGFQPCYDIFCWWCQRMFTPQVPCTPSRLHCPIANSASTQSQQPV